MTLDQAIKHCLKVAEESEYSAIMFKQKKEASAFLEKAEAEKAENDCKQCAADHRQLAEWLTELKHLRDEVHRMKPDLDDKNRALKEAKRLLKLAVDDANSEAESLCAFCKHNHVVDGCPYIESYSECEYIWRYTDEALKLIKEEK